MDKCDIVCDQCGKTFKGFLKKHAKWRFCDRVCLTLARKSDGIIGKSRKAHEYEHTCLTCGNIFLCTKKRKKQQYCDVDCAAVARQSGGIIAQKVDVTTMQNYGVNRFFENRELFIDSIREKYGVDNVSLVPEVRRKAEQTMIERYGAKTALQSDELREKIRLTNLKKYGAENVFASDIIKRTIRETCLEKYGVECAAKSDVVREKKRYSNLEKYGVECTFQCEEVKQKIYATMIERYGFPNPMMSPSIREKIDYVVAARKCHETMKRNGTYHHQQSIVENTCYHTLCELFGDINVERHVIVSDWDIDLYIKECDVYLQVDGVYWHGLDRPINIIRESNVKRDVAIYKTFLRDITQNEWFMNNHKKLVRITDKEIKLWQKNKSLHQMLKTRLSTA